MEDHYLEFLKRKVAIAEDYGFEIDRSELNPLLKPHEQDIVLWAIKGGKRAIFASFGLGKSIMQIEIFRLLVKHTKLKALLTAPLGVRQEFYKDGMFIGENWEKSANDLGLNITDIRKQFGIEFQFIRRSSEINEGNFYLTNYESVRDGKLNPNLFGISSLDEASILRGYGTKTYQTFLTLFNEVSYKFVCTATPSPNRFKELIHYGGYLGIMDTGQALTRFFQRDSTKANKLTLYPHKEKEFWLWLSTWGVFITKPSDLNPEYSDLGYDLPEIKYIFHELPVDHTTAGIDEDGQVKMYRDANVSLRDASKEKRDSISDRINKMAEILETDKESHWLIWHHLESEREAINSKIGKGFDVYGSQDMEIREKRIIDFSNGEIKYLSTKPEIAGSGCNFQRFCHKSIFVGINYKFNDFIQAIHRIYRFLQMFQVEINIISTESEREILKVMMEKQINHFKLVDNMVRLIKENGLNNQNSAQKLLRTMGVELKEIKSKTFHIANNDCVLDSRMKADNSIGLVVTSIPFSNHYEYTPSYNDFGHTKNNTEFWEQMDFLTPELHRILMPGRVAAIHVKDRILFSSMTEFSFPTVSPFHMECGMHFIKHGFGFLGMVTIETDVVRENNQTYRLGWSEKCKDSSKMGVGSPEYLMFFRKQPTTYDNAYSDIPVMKSKDGKDFMCTCGFSCKLDKFAIQNEENVICPNCNELKTISELWNLPLYTRGQWQIDARAKWNSSGNRLMTPEETKGLDLSQVANIFAQYFESNIYDYETHVKTANDLDNYGRLPATFESLRLKARNWFLWDDVTRMKTLNSEQSRKKMNMHICPLQFDIVDRTIEGFSNPGESVYDPFGGIMTTPYRAILKRRIGIASELNSDYFRDGSVYCRAAESQVSMPSLFDAFDLK